jgi:hypothetical protein
MQKHRLRLLLIAICLWVVIFALVGGLALGITDEKAIAADDITYTAPRPH